MSPEDMMAAQKAQTETHVRQQALQTATQRAKPDATMDEILAEARKLVEFVLGPDAAAGVKLT